MFTESDTLENLGKIGGGGANKGLMILKVKMSTIGCSGTDTTISGSALSAFPGQDTAALFSYIHTHFGGRCR